MEFGLKPWQLTWCILIFLIGTIGNVLVISVILKCKRLVRSAPFNIYILALACTDLTCSIIITPNYLFANSLDVRVSEKEIGKLYCNIVSHYFFPFWSCLVSIYILVLISFERRRAVLYPFTILNKQRHLKTVLILCSVIFSTLIVKLCAGYKLTYDPQNPSVGNFCAYSFSEHMSLIVYSSMFIVQYIIPCCIFVTSFIQMKNKMNSQSRSLLSMMSHCDDATIKRQAFKLWKQQKRTLSTMKLVIAAFLIFITPNEVFHVIFHLFHWISITWDTSITWNSPPYQIGMMLKFSNCCVNPILYSFFSSRFQGHFKEVFPFIVLKWKSYTLKFKCEKQTPYTNFDTQLNDI